MAYYVGLDSGGTKTECWLGDETRVLATGVTASVKRTRVSEEIATARLRELLEEVAAKAGVGLREVSATCMGIAGFSIAEVREWAERTLHGLVSGAVEVCGDDEIALDAAFRGGLGILVIAGTGSVVLGRSSTGARIKAGGWGPGIGDEGSGYWIGRQALRRAFAQLDEGREGMLLDGIREAWGVTELDEIVALANASTPPDVPSLTRVVARCADAGDEVAIQLLRDAGDELGRQVAIVRKKLAARGDTHSSVVYAGSVLENLGLVRANMLKGAIARCEGLNFRDLPAKSAEGALWRARKAVGA